MENNGINHFQMGIISQKLVSDAIGAFSSLLDYKKHFAVRVTN